MPTISDAELHEYQHLRRVFKLYENWKSVYASETLEADIDEPIKRCVMALALSGFTVRWACCGFDYIGQPIHKAHQYGCCGIVLAENPESLLLADHINGNRVFGWRAQQWEVYGRKQVSLLADIESGNTWKNPDHIHYSEPAAISIKCMEDFLMMGQGVFLDSVTLRDTNWEFRDRFPWWQYPPKQDWVIRKSDLVPEDFRVMA